MALPVGHALLGASMAALFLPQDARPQSVRILLTSALIAVSPDFDYLFYRVLDWGEAWHRSFSHSITFALAVGALATIAIGPRKPKVFLIYSLAIISHPILDALVSERGGVQFLWPLSNDMFHFGLIGYPNVFRDGADQYTVVRRVLEYSLIEGLILAPPLVFIFWLRRLGGGGRSPSRQTV
jgi:membrane-bound metal-dependent hydrolase YbcI (DUF457 family)